MNEKLESITQVEKFKLSNFRRNLPTSLGTFQLQTIQLLVFSICPLKQHVSQKYLLGLFPSNFVEAIENSTNHAGSAEPQKKDDQNERVVVKVDEKLLDSTLYAVESVDPTIEDDEPGMIKNEQICKQMGKSLSKKIC